MYVRSHTQELPQNQRAHLDGHYQNLVKRSQRTYLTPLPEIPDLDALNVKLVQDCLAERERTDRQGQSYGALWEAEKPNLLNLPADTFSDAHRHTRLFSEAGNCDTSGQDGR